jgi:hypothetical protein
MQEWKQAGLSQQAIADKLNSQGHTTRRGKPWSQVQVMRVLERAECLARTSTGLTVVLRPANSACYCSPRGKGVLGEFLKP